MGMQVQLPGGAWARAAAPAVFAAKDSKGAFVAWPWGGIAHTGDGRIVVLTQHCPLLAGGGVNAEVTRTVCAVRIPAASLPFVVITGREGVPLRDLRRAVQLELETFNRSLWAFGLDPRAV